MEILDCVTITPELADNFAPFIPATLLEDLRSGKVWGLGSFLGNIPNGALIFEIEKNAARILSLYVDQYDRRNGTGRFLVKKLRALLRTLPDIYSIRAPLPDNDTDAAAFFEALDARIEKTESYLASFPLSALKNSPLFSVPKSPHCVPGTKLGRDTLTYFQRVLEKDRAMLIEGNLWEPPVYTDLSWYYVKNRTIQGCVVVSKTQSGLSLAMMVNCGAPTVLPLLLGALLGFTAKTFPPETIISLEAAVPETRKLMDRYVPTAEKRFRQVAVLAV